MSQRSPACMKGPPAIFFFRRLHLVFKILQMPPAVLKRFFRGSKAHFGFFFQMGPVVKRFLQFKLKGIVFFGTKWIFTNKLQLPCQKMASSHLNK